MFRAEGLAPAHAQGCAGDTQREDCALVRVDAGGRTAHVCLSQKPRHAERVKACLRIPAAMRQTDARAGFKISTKGACAVDKGEYIHVIVRTRIMAIDQPRLGRYGNLAEQRALCVFRCAPDKSLFKMRVDDFACTGKEQSQKVVYFGHRAHCGARIFVGCFLFNANYRT